MTQAKVRPPAPRTFSLQIRGALLACASWPAPAAPEAAIDGPAPTLVLLHDGLGCIATWRDFPTRLAAQLRLPVFAYSRLGYGSSSAVDLPRPASYMHDEALETLPLVLSGAGIERAVLLGHSDGGTIALIACSGPARARIQAVISIAAHVFVEPQSIAAVSAAGEAYRHGSLRERLRQYHGDRVDDAFFGWHDTWTNPAFHDWNVESYLARVDVPTLVMQGTADPYGTLAQVDAIVGGCSGSTTRRVFPGGGHVSHRERPEELVEAITGFLRQHGIACLAGRI